MGIRMRIMSRYLSEEYLRTILFGLGILTAILYLRKAFTIVELVILHGFGLISTLGLVLLTLPPILIFTLPMSVLLAALLLFGRMSADSELTAWQAGGISLTQLLKPLLGLTLIIGLLSFCNNAILAPYAYRAIETITTQGRVIDPIAALRPQTLTKIEKYLISVGRVEPSTRSLSEIYLNFLTPNGERQTVVAQKGSWRELPNEKGWEIALERGAILSRDPLNPETLRSVRFNRYTLQLERSFMAGQKETRPKAMGLVNLFKTAYLSGAEPETAPAETALTEYRLEFNRRLAIPVASLLFLVIGAVLGSHQRRSGRNIGLGLSLVIFLGYYLLLAAGESMALARMIPAVLAVWLPNIAIAGIGAAYLLPRPSRSVVKTKRRGE